MILALKIFSLVKESDKRNKNYNSGLTPWGKCHTEGSEKSPEDGVVSSQRSLETSWGKRRDH